MIRSIGPVEIVANKTNIGFMTRARFAGVLALSGRGMILHLWLKRRIESPRIAKAEHLREGHEVGAQRV